MIKESLISPICNLLQGSNILFEYIRYGLYRPEELKIKANSSKAVIFLCEHETQGLAYQQILSSVVPILAWGRGVYWQDSSYYPQKSSSSLLTPYPIGMNDAV